MASTFQAGHGDTQGTSSAAANSTMVNGKSQRVVKDKDQTKEPPIYKISVDILQEIVSHLDEPKDPLALTKVNRSLYKELNPTLYKNDVKFNDASSLFWAARRGNLPTLKHARAAGVDLNLRGPTYYNTITDPDTGVQTRVRVHARTANGTPLHYAAQNGHGHVVKWLIDQGVDINAPSQGLCNCGIEGSISPERNHPIDPQWTPLHTALCAKKLSVAILLIDHNSSLNLRARRAVRYNRGIRPLEHALHLASARGFVSVIDRLRLTPNFDVNARDARQNTALHHAAECLEGGPDSPGIHNTILKLLSLGADINAVNLAGESPLVTASGAKNFPFALKLLSLGATPIPNLGQTTAANLVPPYHCLDWDSWECGKVYRWPTKHVEGGEYCRNGRKAERRALLLIRELVNSGVDVDARFDRGLTALMIACRGHRSSSLVVRELLRCRASINIQDAQGNTPLSYCLEEGRSHHACLLLRLGARLDLAHNFVDKVRRSGVFTQQMVNASTKDNISSDSLEKLLWMERERNYAQRCSDETYVLLLELARKTYGLSKMKIKQYLELCFDRDSPIIFRYLVDKGYVHLVANQVEVTHPKYLANSSTVYASLDALLAKSLSRGSYCLSDDLVSSSGLSVRGPRFARGQTLLHLAVTNGHVNVIKELLKRGAEVDPFDNDLNTPLLLEIWNGPGSSSWSVADMASTLLEGGANPHIRLSD